MFSKAIITLFATLAAAQIHKPVGEPSGNAISRPLNEVVPTCQKFTITWTPSTPNTVSVLLLKGPPTNVVKFGPSLAEGIVNSGSLVWTPAADLPLTDGTPLGYGIQIIDDVTGQYQYSTQFGISKGDCSSYSASSVASSSGYPASSKPTVAPSMSGYPTHNTTISTSISHSTASHNVTVSTTKTVAPSASASASKTATTSGLPQQTANAGSALQAGLSLAGAAAAFAFLL